MKRKEKEEEEDDDSLLVSDICRDPLTCKSV